LCRQRDNRQGPGHLLRTQRGVIAYRLRDRASAISGSWSLRPSTEALGHKGASDPSSDTEGSLATPSFDPLRVGARQTKEAKHNELINRDAVMMAFTGKGSGIREFVQEGERRLKDGQFAWQTHINKKTASSVFPYERVILDAAEQTWPAKGKAPRDYINFRDKRMELLKERRSMRVRLQEAQEAEEMEQRLKDISKERKRMRVKQWKCHGDQVIEELWDAYRNSKWHASRALIRELSKTRRKARRSYASFQASPPSVPRLGGSLVAGRWGRWNAGYQGYLAGDARRGEGGIQATRGHPPHARPPPDG
jgi:hypothetical protein